MVNLLNKIEEGSSSVLAVLGTIWHYDYRKCRLYNHIDVHPILCPKPGWNQSQSKFKKVIGSKEFKENQTQI